jgi:hypothetical protein
MVTMDDICGNGQATQRPVPRPNRHSLWGLQRCARSERRDVCLQIRKLTLVSSSTNSNKKKGIVTENFTLCWTSSDSEYHFLDMYFMRIKSRTRSPSVGSGSG